LSRHREGIPAAPGIVIGPARVLHMQMPAVPHGAGIAPDHVEDEVARFQAACETVKSQIRRVQERTRERLGSVEAQIFEPQIMMLEDPDLVGGTIDYIRENHLPAERAFEWRVLEWEAQWSHTAHPMVLDKLNDLADVQARVLRHLMGLPEPELDMPVGTEGVVLVARELTPSLAAQLDGSRILGLATDSGTRASHSSILTRSLKIPSVVSLGRLSEEVQTGDEILLDGRTGRVIISPTEEEKRTYRELDFQIREWEQELLLLAHLEPKTTDGAHIALCANIDLPGEAASAVDHGADGVGLFRTEFLVVGRSSVPIEEEQYQAYRQVLEAFPDKPVVIRTYDLGGDKFPAFLHMPKEENPFLGWRAIRVCLDEPVLFRAQLRALLRAGAHGDVRIMLPLVNEISEIERTRELLDSAADELRSEGHEFPDRYILGAMIETPAAAVAAPELARHVDFFSVGTNDLVQYTLAVDRGNSRLSGMYTPFHPSVVRLLNGVAEAGRAAGIEVSVCGEMAAHPLGAFLLIGMGVDSLSVGPSALAEIKKVIRSVSQKNARAALEKALRASSPAEVIEVLISHVSGDLDLTRFAGSWTPSHLN
jgi:phosphotransferase system enzyme I (PtsI)